MAIERLKREAARLGANGLVLEDVEDDDDGSSVGAGLSKVAATSDGQPFSFNVGTSTHLFSAKSARGLAIYVPPQ
jgi:hypothetical protein